MPGFPAGAVFVDVVPSFSGFPNALRNGLIGPVADAGSNAGNEAGDGLRGGFLGKIGKLAGPLAAAVGAIGIGAIITSAITSGIDNETITDRLSASLGATGPTATKLGKIAGNLYAGAYGDSMEDVADSLQGILSSGLIDQDAAQADIESLSAKVLNLSATFGEEAGAISNAAEQMLRTGLADNATQAFDVLSVGLSNGTNKAGDLLDTFGEYGVQFQKLGLDGSSALGLLSQGLQGGARDADLVADALKEFSIRAVDGSTTSAAAYEALGLSAHDMTEQIARGGPEASAGLSTVLERLKAVQDPAQKAAIATGLFGTQAEDLGAALYSLDPSTAVAGLGEVAGAADKLGVTLNDNAGTNIESFKRQLSQMTTETIGGVVLPGIGRLASAVSTGLGPAFGDIATGVDVFVEAFRGGEVTTLGFLGTLGSVAYAARSVYDSIIGAGKAVGGFVSDHSTSLSILAGAVGGAAAGFGLLYVVTQAIKALQFGVFLVQYAAQVGVVNLATRAWALVQAGLNLVMSANPIGVVVILLAALAGAVLIAWRNSETFRSIVLGAWSAVKDGVGSVVSWFTDTALPFLTGVFESIGAAASWLYTNVITPVWEGIRSAVDVAVKLISGYVNLYVGVLRTLWEAVTYLYVNVVGPVFELITAAVRLAYEWVRDNVFAPLVDWLGGKLSLAFTVYRDLAVAVWQAVRDGVSAAWTWMRDNVFTPLTSFLRDTLGPRFTALRDVAVGAWQLLRDGVNVVWVFLRDNVFVPLGTFLLVTVPGYFTSGKDRVGTAWDALGAKVQAPISWLGTYVWGPLNSFLTVTLPGYFTSAANLIGTAWDAVKEKAKAPVRFVVQTVINRGIVGTFNSLAGMLGTTKLKEIALPEGFAGGGSIRGPGSATSDSIPAWLSNGEYVVKASSVQRLGTGFLDALNAGQFASGGLVGVVTDPVGTMRGAIGNLLADVPQSGAFTELVLGLPRKVLDLVIDKVTGLATKLTDVFTGGGDDGGAVGSTGGSGVGWKWQIATLRAAFPGLALNSGDRPGAFTATGNVSWHSRGRAVDVPPRSDVFEWIRSNYGADTKELIFSPKGIRQLHNGQPHIYGEPTKSMHYNHVHWAYRDGGLVAAPPLSYDSGGYLPSGLSTVFNGTRAPEPVFTSAQAAALAAAADPRQGNRATFESLFRDVYPREEVDVDVLARRMGYALSGGGLGGGS